MSKNTIIVLVVLVAVGLAVWYVRKKKAQENV